MAEPGLGQLALNLGSALGGIGLFLLAVDMITDGLKTAAGSALRDILGRWTSTTGRGVLAGIGITALVQSSSAVTVATIGFVNAGLLTLYQALGVIYGANVGTTVTGWLVAAVGFEFNLELFALPLVGVGMALRLLGGDGRRGAVGKALAGFGLFFIGLAVLKTAFEGLEGTVLLNLGGGDGLWQLALYVGVGAVMTLVTQSSSAAIAITLSAATGGILSLPAAAAMVIGANVGTTTTAGLAVIGATANAKRVAVAHLMFNLITAAVALLVMPGMLWLVRVAGGVLGLQDVPAVSLALFHTVFNLLGVAIMFPWSHRLSRWLATRFRSQEERLSRPRHLDPNVLVTPTLALNALVLETARVGRHARGLAQAVLSAEQQAPLSIRGELLVVVALSDAIGTFVTRLQRTALPAVIAEQLPVVLRTGQYYLEVGELARDYAGEGGVRTGDLPAPLAAAIDTYVGQVARVLAQADPQQDGFAVAEHQGGVAAVEDDYRRVKDMLLSHSAEAGPSATQVGDLLEQLRRLRRIAQQVVKAAGYLDGLLAVVQHPEQILAAKHAADRASDEDALSR